MEKAHRTLRCKVAVVGDVAVGKTALATQFCDSVSKFPKNYIMTRGLSLNVKKVNIPDTNTVVELFLFDTGGHEAYNSLHNLYWSGSSMIMLVFDMANQKSFEDCADWFKKYKEIVDPIPVKGVLVGTKADLKEENAVMVNAAEVIDFANSKKLRYFETSAKEGRDVEAPFHFIANVFYNQYEEEIKHLKAGIE
mmetsp:Transcript_15413/g.18533  ORF Transcript_15413/g.18533 Transcript_15413/m.18533 type:complete len:194 (-) Transcript_15413:61-642(-)